METKALPLGQVHHNGTNGTIGRDNLWDGIFILNIRLLLIELGGLRLPQPEIPSGAFVSSNFF